MENENRMEQHYAVSKSDVLVHINDARNSEEECFCPHCGCRMLKRCGNIRAWHFAHDYRYNKEYNKECSYESYLHAFAKIRLKQWFDESKSIILHYNEKIPLCQYAKDCIWKENSDDCSQVNKKTIDLKKYLTQCKPEETIHANDNIFRADLLWSNPNNPKNDILIEIKVTHECTQKKKESQKRIIEFEIHSEKDVEYIVANDIKESDTVRFYGFTSKEVIDKTIPAKYSLSKFIYYKSGKTFPRLRCNCNDYWTRQDNALLEISFKDSDIMKYISTDESDTSENFPCWLLSNWGLSLAWKKGFDAKNCKICTHRYYVHVYNEQKLTCKLRHELTKKALTAISCSDYSIDEDLCRQKLEEFMEFQRYNPVDVWSKCDKEEFESN